MFDRIFSALLAFGMLAAATMAIGAAWFERPIETARLPRVEVTGKRVAAPPTLAQSDTAAVTTRLR